MKYITMVVLLIGLLTFRADAPPAEAADWNQSDINDIIDKVTDIESSVNGSTGLMFRTSNLPHRLTNIEAMIPSVNGTNGLMDRTSNLPQKLSNLQDTGDDILGEVGDVPEIVQNMREGRGKVTQEMFDAIDDAVVVLQEEITEERAGLDDFKTPTTAGQDCSDECVQFRKDIDELLANMQALSNTLIEVDPGLGIDAQIDLSKTRDLIQTLPAAGLYPLFRVTNRDSQIFGSGIVQLMGDLDDDIRTIAVGTRTGSGGTISNLSLGAQSGTVTDTLTQCGEIMQDASGYEFKTRRVFGAGLTFQAVGELLKAVGGTRVLKPEIQVHGYPGMQVYNNRTKKVGIVFSGLGKQLTGLGSYGFGKLRYCTTLDATQRCDLEIAVDEQTAGTNQGDFRFSVLTTLDGKRIRDFVRDPSHPLNPFIVFVNDSEVPKDKVHVSPSIEGVERVQVDRDALPSPRDGFLLTVQATVVGDILEKTCNDFTMVQGTAPQQGGAPSGNPPGRG